MEGGIPKLPANLDIFIEEPGWKPLGNEHYKE